jgi:uncharacterized membrane protein YkvA (DUF1232 family)
MTDIVEDAGSQPVMPNQAPEPITWTADAEPGNPALDAFWVAVKRLPKYLKLVANMARDGEVPAKAKAALAVGGVYTVSPVDLVPGIIPVAGQLDDLVVLLLAIRMAVRACPPELADAHLERVGLARANFDEDLAAVKAVALWLAGKGWQASRRAAVRGGRALAAFWQERIRPHMTAD